MGSYPFLWPTFFPGCLSFVRLSQFQDSSKNFFSLRHMRSCFGSFLHLFFPLTNHFRREIALVSVFFRGPSLLFPLFAGPDSLKLPLWQWESKYPAEPPQPIQSIYRRFRIFCPLTIGGVVHHPHVFTPQDFSLPPLLNQPSLLPCLYLLSFSPSNAGFPRPEVWC